MTVQNDYEKPYWWDGNLAWMLKQEQLWKSPGKPSRKLAYAYREMIGGSGHHMYERLAKYLPEPGYFEGVDWLPDLLMRQALQFHRKADGTYVPECDKAKPHFQLILGDFFATTLLRLKDRKRIAVGVVNCDTQDAISEGWWTKHRDPLREIVEVGAEHCPAFTLILNHPLGIGGGFGVSVMDQVRIHAEGIVKTLSPRWHDLKAADLLRGIDADALRNLPLKAGGFYVYRSRDTTTHEENIIRMITIRLTFDRKRRGVVYDRPRRTA